MSGPRIVDLALTAFFFVVGVYAIADIRDFPFQDRLFPVAAAIVILICVVAYAIRQVVAPIAIEEESGPGAANQPFSRQEIRTLAGPWAAVALLIAGVLLVGFLIAVPLFVFCYIALRGEKPVIAGAAAAVMFLFVWGLLANGMGVQMPEPILAEWVKFY